jgi:hypothetical protein
MWVHFGDTPACSRGGLITHKAKLSAGAMSKNAREAILQLCSFGKDMLASIARPPVPVAELRMSTNVHAIIYLSLHSTRHPFRSPGSMQLSQTLRIDGVEYRRKVRHSESFKLRCRTMGTQQNRVHGCGLRGFAEKFWRRQPDVPREANRARP